MRAPAPVTLLLKALRGRRLRTLLAIAGVAMIAQLVLVLFAVYRGPVASVAQYVGQPGIDFWVAPVGTDNLMRASGVLPVSLVDELRKVEGVASADALLRVFVSATRSKGDADSPRLTLMAFGFRAPDGLGGPPLLSAGRAPEGADEIALDRAAAHRLSRGVGEELLVNGRPVKVVGITRGTNLLATQFLFFDVRAAQRASGLLSQTSFIVVKLAPGADRAATAKRLKEALPEAALYERSAFVTNSVREAVAGILPVLALVAILGVAVAAVLVALLVHGIVEDRRGDIAVLLLLGTRPSRVAFGLVAHAAFLVLVGGLVGAGLALGLSSLLDRTLPTIELSFSPGDLARVLTLFTAAGVVGAAAPVARLRNIDPLEAFRS